MNEEFIIENWKLLSKIAPETTLEVHDNPKITQQYLGIDGLNSNQSPAYAYFKNNREPLQLPDYFQLQENIERIQQNIENLNLLYSIIENYNNPYDVYIKLLEVEKNKNINENNLKTEYNNSIGQIKNINSYLLNICNEIINELIIDNSSKISLKKSIVEFDSIYNSFEDIKYDILLDLDQYSYLKATVLKQKIKEIQDLKNLANDKQKVLKIIKNDLSILNSFVKIKFWVGSNEGKNIPLGIIFNRAIFAMFVGIFFQLITQDKSMTEPV